MKYLLTVEAHGLDPSDAITYARAVLDGSVHDGKPRGFVIGGASGSASSAWRILFLTDEGDESDELRTIVNPPATSTPAPAG